MAGNQGKGGGAKRTEFQREMDLALTAERYLHGIPIFRIAQEFGVSSSQICDDLKEIRENWLRSSMVDFNEAKAKELAKIDDLEVIYRQAWDRSQKPSRSTTTEHLQKPDSKREKKIEVLKPGGKKARAEYKALQESYKAQVKEEQRDGNPAFLKGVEWCIEMRCRIFGLYAPTQAQLLDANGKPIGELAVKTYINVDIDKV